MSSLLLFNIVALIRTTFAIKQHGQVWSCFYSPNVSHKINSSLGEFLEAGMGRMTLVIPLASYNLYLRSIPDQILIHLCYKCWQLMSNSHGDSLNNTLWRKSIKDNDFFVEEKPILMTIRAILSFFLFFLFLFLFSLECVSWFWVGYSWNRRPGRPVGGTPLLGSAQNRVPFSGLRYMKP